MLSCESCQVLIADGLYDQLTESDNRQLQQHLQSCIQCKQVMHEVQAAKAELESRSISSDNYDDIPERAALDDLWYRLQPELDSIDAERYRQSHRSNRPFLSTWGPALAMAASVVLIFSVVLVNINQPAPTSTVEVASSSRQSVPISPELMDYLGRAESMLLMVANAESQQGELIPIRQSFARDMAFEASMLTMSEDDSFSSGQSKLLRDIEFLLLQIANLDERNMQEGVNLLQRFIEENSILFKIRLLEMRNQDTVI